MPLGMHSASLQCRSLGQHGKFLNRKFFVENSNSDLYQAVRSFRPSHLLFLRHAMADH
jgi:hypothetical protein